MGPNEKRLSWQHGVIPTKALIGIKTQLGSLLGVTLVEHL